MRVRPAADSDVLCQIVFTSSAPFVPPFVSPLHYSATRRGRVTAFDTAPAVSALAGARGSLSAARYNTSPMPGVYLDHNATTPLDPRVREAMLPWLGERFGNPSSIHRIGQAARNAVEEAREQVAALIGGRPPEVVFAASGTEANNTVVASAVEGARRAGGDGGGHRGRHLVISAIEHPSVRQAAARAERAGLEVTRVPPGEDGVVPAAAMIAALRPDTVLACLMLANNEVGKIGRASCRERV